MGTAHNHPADHAAVEALKKRIELKDKAKTTKNRPLEMFTEALSSSQPEVRVKIGDRDTVKRDIRRQRQGALPRDPASSHVSVSRCWPTLTKTRSPAIAGMADS